MTKYKAEMIAGITIDVPDHEQFREFITPALRQICSGEIVSQTLGNGNFNIHAVVDPNKVDYPYTEHWSEVIKDLCIGVYRTEILAVGVDLYLTDKESNEEYWVFMREGDGEGDYVLYSLEEDPEGEVEVSYATAEELDWGT